MKRRVDGVGMVQREVFHDFESADEMAALLRKNMLAGGPEKRWAQREAFYLEILRRSGASPEDYPEDSAQHIAICWLRAWRAAQNAREKGDLLALMMHAEEMGLQTERMYWRAGVDPNTRERREALVLREKAVNAGRRDGGKTNATAAAGRRAIAQSLAAEIVGGRTRPISGRDLAVRVLSAWPEGHPAPSEGAVRRYLAQK